MKKFIEYIKTKGVLFATWFGVSNPFGSDSFTTVDGTAQKVVDLINGAVAFSALAAVAAIVYGGIKIIISAQGESDHLEEGRQTIQAAIIGMVVIFLAGTIIKFLISEGIILGIAGVLYV